MNNICNILHNAINTKCCMLFKTIGGFIEATSDAGDRKSICIPHARLTSVTIKRHLNKVLVYEQCKYIYLCVRSVRAFI